MKGLKKKRRIQIIVLSFVALFGAAGLIGYTLRSGINLYRAPTQVLADQPGPKEVFRLGGLVEDGSLQRGEVIRFTVTDGAASVPVTYRGILPDLFGEGQGMIGTGRFVDGTFEATEILAKHDENYMPKEVIDSLKATGVYEAPDS